MRAGRTIQIVAGIGGAAVLALALWPSATRVDTATVVRGPMQVTVDEEGVTRVRERFVVAAPVAGQLERIEWEPGDVVHRGTVLARLRDAAAPLIDARTRAEWQAALRAAEAAHGQAAAERARAHSTRDRLQVVLRQQTSLSAAGAVARDDVDAARTALTAADAAAAAADAAVDRAAHELEVARARLRTPSSGRGVVSVTAPCDGVVLRRLRESESVVGAGEPLIELGNSRALELVTDVLSADAVKIAIGAPVLVEEWGGEDVLHGEVRRIEPAGFMKVSALGVEEQRVNVIIALPERERADLGDGYRATVRIQVWGAPDVLKVPMGSVFRHGSDWAAFVVDHGRARLRVLRLTHRNDVEAAVDSGLSAGDEVVIHPPDNLTDGVRVRRATTATPAAQPTDPGRGQ